MQSSSRAGADPNGPPDSGPALVPAPPARLLDLFAALDALDASWSLLRPPASLATTEGDIDVLVAPADRDRIPALMEQQGFTIVRRGGGDVHAVDLDAATARFLWLHVQDEVRLGGETVPATAVLAGTVRDPLPRPSDAWLLWILLLHALLDKGGVAERHRGEVRRLAAAAPNPPPPLAAIVERHGLVASELAAHAAAGSWDRLDDAAAPRRRPALRERVAGALSELRGPRGIGVAVIGPDGAGKTTLIAGLRAALPFPTRVVYMGLTGGRLPRADALRVPGLVFAARLAILWLRWGAGAYHRARGRIVLFDRYVLDGRVPSGAALGPLARVSRRLQASACPRPDLVLLLDASGTTMRARSGEYDAQRLERWRGAFRRIPGVELLDAERPADMVLRDALTLVWRRCAARWQ